MSYQVGKDGEHFQTETLYAIKYPNGEWYQKTSASNVFREDECHSSAFFKSKLDAHKSMLGLLRDRLAGKNWVEIIQSRRDKRA